MPPSLAPVPLHRSMRRLSPGFGQVVTGVLLLPLGFDLALWLSRHVLSGAWATLFAFWVQRLELTGRVERRSFGPAEVDVFLPHLEVPARPVSGALWACALGVTLALLFLSGRLPDSQIPLRYLLRLVAVLQGTALAYFAFPSSAPPYTTPEYLDGMLDSAAWLLVLVPWIHGVVYHLFEFSLARKVAFTLLTLAFISVATPFQVMLHAYLLAAGSVLFMPVLYLLGGTWLLVFGCIALYGMAMSWPRRSAAPSGWGSSHNSSQEPVGPLGAGEADRSLGASPRNPRPADF